MPTDRCQNDPMVVPSSSLGFSKPLTGHRANEMAVPGPKQAGRFNLTQLVSICAMFVMMGMLVAVLVVLESSPSIQESATLNKKIEEYKVQLQHARAREAELLEQIRQARRTPTKPATPATKVTAKDIGVSPIPKILHLIWISRDGVAPPLPSSVQDRAKFMRESHEKAGWEVILPLPRTV